MEPSSPLSFRAPKVTSITEQMAKELRTALPVLVECIATAVDLMDQLASVPRAGFVLEERGLSDRLTTITTPLVIAFVHLTPREGSVNQAFIVHKARVNQYLVLGVITVKLKGKIKWLENVKQGTSAQVVHLLHAHSMVSLVIFAHLVITVRLVPPHPESVQRGHSLMIPATRTSVTVCHVLKGSTVQALVTPSHLLNATQASTAPQDSSKASLLAVPKAITVSVAAQSQSSANLEDTRMRYKRTRARSAHLDIIATTRTIWAHSTATFVLKDTFVQTAHGTQLSLDVPMALTATRLCFTVQSSASVARQENIVWVSILSYTAKLLGWNFGMPEKVNLKNLLYGSHYSCNFWKTGKTVMLPKLLEFSWNSVENNSVLLKRTFKLPKLLICNCF